MTCSNPNKFICSENWDTKDCGQLEHAKFKNYGCTFQSNYAYNYFECSNRIDQRDGLFNIPPLLRSKGRSNLNEILNFDNTTIYCGPGHLNFSCEDLFVVNADHRDEFCELKDGSEISILCGLIFPS